MKSTSRYLPLLIACVGALAIAACGSADPSKTPDTGTTVAQGDSGYLGEIAKTVDALYKETFSSPPTSGPKPQPGKKVWSIMYGPAGLNTELIGKAITDIGAEFGWQTEIVNGEFSSAAQLTGIRRAVAANADAIILYVIDCPGIKAGLEEAKRANIAVIAIESFDCVDLAQGEPSLFTSGIGEYNTAPFGDKAEYGDGWIQGFAKAPIAWFIHELEGKAHVILPRETDAHATLLEDQGARDELGTCANCSIAGTFDFTGQDFGPKLQDKTSQAILRAPKANAIFGVYDAPITSGIAAGSKSLGRELLVSGGEGYPPNVDLIHDGVQSVGVGLAIEWEAYAAMDTVNRIFHGEKAVPNGIGLALFDAKHGLPPKGKMWEPNIDYKSVYRKTWGLK